MISEKELEREYQIRLDLKARVNMESFQCQSCEEEFLLSEICDHDEHNYCIPCCEACQEVIHDE